MLQSTLWILLVQSMLRLGIILESTVWMSKMLLLKRHGSVLSTMLQSILWMSTILQSPERHGCCRVHYGCFCCRGMDEYSAPAEYTIDKYDCAKTEFLTICMGYGRIVHNCCRVEHG